MAGNNLNQGKFPRPFLGGKNPPQLNLGKNLNPFWGPELKGTPGIWFGSLSKRRNLGKEPLKFHPI